MSYFSNIIFVHVLACEDCILIAFLCPFSCVPDHLFVFFSCDRVCWNKHEQKNPLNYLQSNFSGVLYPIVTITSCKKWPNKSRAPFPLPLCSSCFYSTLQRRQRSQISSSVSLIKSGLPVQPCLIQDQISQQQQMSHTQKSIQSIPCLQLNKL